MNATLLEKRRVAPSSDLLEVRPGGQLEAMAASVADDRVDARALYLQALLHLPRLADRRGLVPSRSAWQELARLSAREEERRADPPSFTCAPRDASLETARVDAVSDGLAQPVLERFHYLHSHREGGAHYGLLFAGSDEPRIGALATVSPLDVGTLASALPHDVPAEQAAILSRVYAFPWAPTNSISFLLARVAGALRAERPELQVLFTYLNPNMGFDGASYRSANWSFFGYELGTRYSYLDGDYITDRRLSERCARAQIDPRRVQHSTMRLEPLHLYCYVLDRRLRSRYVDGFAHILGHPLCVLDRTDA